METASIPFLTADQMRQVDRVMIARVGVTLLQMMENAGRSLARLARDRILKGDPRGKRVTVLAGSGGNGGGALAAARHLRNWGAETEIYILPPKTDPSVAYNHQAQALRWDGAVLASAEDLSEASEPDVVLDGIIGYGLDGPVRGDAGKMVAWANRKSAAVVALDIPTGIDATIGAVDGPAVRATATLTLALPKTGLARPEAKGCAGELFLADIGVPPSVYSLIDPPVAPGFRFASNDILRLW